MANRNPRRPSVMRNAFGVIPSADTPRASFDRSHGYKSTFDAGQLIPIMVEECIPGDTHSVNMTAFARLATPIKPLMDNMFLDSQFFFVPMRLIWDNWQKFCGEQVNPGDSTDFTVPEISITNGWQPGTMGDYMGVPTLVNDTKHNVLPMRAYNLIYNEWYRDQNLQNSVTVNKGDTLETDANVYAIRNRGKRPDYFTSCLPFPQKGDSVSVPAAGTAPIRSDATTAGDHVTWLSTANFAGGEAARRFNTSTAQLQVTSTTNPADFALYADLSGVQGTNINQLRQAFQIQKLIERDARGGTRYVEILRAHYNIKNHPDARLNRPEYLGGGTSPVNFSAVPQTQATDQTGETPQGNLAAVGTVSATGHGFKYSCVEHGYIIGIVSVRADLNYQQGLDKKWQRKTRYDFYWPALSRIGEQAVLQSEIFYTATPAADDTVFGYQERYAEYRYGRSQITGLFRSNVSQPLDFWHLAQDFASAPTLNETFIVEDPPVERVIAVPTEPHFLFDAFFSIRSARPMPLYGVPGLIDHF